MRRLILLVLLIFLLDGCFKTPTKTGAISEENRINLSSLSIGMTQQQVLDIMGYPYKTEEKISHNKIYEIWYYITERTLLGQSKLITRNFTPVIFEAGHLIGWGRNFYKYTLDIDNERQKRLQEQSQKYTDDKEEWPKNTHTIIAPMNESKTLLLKKPLEETSLKESIEQEQANVQIDNNDEDNTKGKRDEVEDNFIMRSNGNTSAIKPDTSKTDVGMSESKKNIQTQSASQAKPCAKKSVKTDVCDRCKTPIDSPKMEKKTAPQKTTSGSSNMNKTSLSTTKKPQNASKNNDKSTPCKDRQKDRQSVDDGYNFWE